MNLGKESETLEFKKTSGELKEGMVSISSILNKHGVGTLYFGVKPNGDVVGQNVSESSLRDVSRATYETIRPRIYPVIKEETLDDLHVIKVEFNGDDRPYSPNGRYYLRTADEDREEIPEIPVAVIREAIANSFAHAIYNGNTYHEICIHPGKITIYSPGSYASAFMPEDYIKNPLDML